MTDTHTHIYDSKAFAEGPEAALLRAGEAGVNRFILPNVNTESASEILRLHDAFPQSTWIAAGLHPCDATDRWRSQLDEIMAVFENRKLVAIGEVGIDLYWDKSTLERQKEVFALQIGIAKQRRLPLIIHSRDAFHETLEVLEEYGKGVPAVFHSFTGNVEDVRRIRQTGDYYFGINGVVTFKNAPLLREALWEIGIDRILLETDSPYLAPVPHRGRRNESAYLPQICSKIAETLGVTVGEVEEATDANAERLFGLN